MRKDKIEIITYNKIGVTIDPKPEPKIMIMVGQINGPTLTKEMKRGVYV